MLNKSIILIFILHLLSCAKQSTIQVANQSQSKTSIQCVWRNYSGALKNGIDSGLCNSISPMLYNSNVLFSEMNSETDNVCGDRIKLVDAKSGKVKWKWCNYLGGPDIIHREDAVIRVNDALVLCERNVVTSLNLKDGSEYWQDRQNLTFGSPFIYNNGKDDYVYQSWILRKYPYTCTLMRTKAQSLNWEKVFTFQDDTINSDLEISDICFYTLNNGHSALAFQASGYSSPKRCANYVGVYDLDADSFQFINKYDKYGFELNVIRMSETKGLLFFTATKYGTGEQSEWVYCIDANTGEYKWMQKLVNNAYHTWTYNNQIIVMTNNEGAIHSFNIYTGKPDWIIPFSMYGPNDKFYAGFQTGTLYKRYLINSSFDYIHIIDLEYGKIVLEEKVPIKNVQGIENGLTIDPENGQMYGTDGMYADAFTIPEFMK